MSSTHLTTAPETPPAEYANNSPVQFDAALTRQQAFKIIENVAGQNDDNAVTYRIAIMLLTKSRAELEAGLQQDSALPGYVLDITDKLTVYLDVRQSETDLLTAAQARLLLILSNYAGIPAEYPNQVESPA